MTILGGSFRHNNTKPPSAIIIPLLIAQTPSTFDRTTTASVAVRERQCRSVPSAELVANAALSLLNLARHLLDRQLAAQAAAFVEAGGFTERLYRVRSQRLRRD